MEPVGLERIINVNYIKYDRLTQISNLAFQNSNASEVNIYIDLYPIIKALFNDDIHVNTYSDITSCIINMCAHYRAFYWSRYRVKSKIYLVYSENCPYINNQFVSGYNYSAQQKFKSNDLMKDIIENNLSILSTLCVYINDVFFIRRNVETSVVIFDLMSKYDLQDTGTHIIISKDPYAFRLCAMKPNTIILRPRKKNNEDTSYFICKENILNAFRLERQSTVDFGLINPELLTLLMAMTSVKERSIKSLVNITSAVKILNDMISKGRIPNVYSKDIDRTCMITSTHMKESPTMVLTNRFKAIDIYFQHQIYMSKTPDYSLEVVNRVDNNTVKEINNQHFINNPLDLERL